jgi:lipopolysaccharide export system protein LptA
MPLTPQRLRRLFAVGAVIAVLAAAFFYLRGIVHSRPVDAKLLKNIPANLDRTGKGFTFSQSAGQKTLFTIHAAGFQQYKDGGKAELSDVSIVVYGREENRSDQIYGSKFSYDPASGDVTAEGEVHIDLDATTPAGTMPSHEPERQASPTPGQSGQAQAGQNQPSRTQSGSSTSNAISGASGATTETKTLIHLKTSGLTFNQKSGIARTNERIEFRVPEASGAAVGAMYDSHNGVLALKSGVKIITSDKNKATITGESASISKDPRQVVLHQAKVEQPAHTISTDKLTVIMGANNNVDRLIGSGNVHATAEGPKGFDITAPQGELQMAAQNQMKSGMLSGGVNYESRGDSPSRGKAGKLLLSFGPKGRVSKVRTEDSVEMTEGPEGKTQKVSAKTLDLFLVDGKRLERAVTSDGPAQVSMERGVTDKAGGGKITSTSVAAGKFVARFSDANRLSSLVGSDGAKLVSSTPGQPDRIATGQDLHAGFNSKGELSTAELAGDLHYEEGTRTATADRGRYSATDDALVLTGSPRIVDTGLNITSDTVELSRKTGNAVAQGNVKTTYRDLKPQSNSGGMLGSSEPIHVTGNSVTASRGTGVAKYTVARLWQGENIVEAPTLTFDKTHRSLQAQGNRDARVTSVFLMPGKNGKSTPANVTSDRLSYVDSDRKAVFGGKVLVKSEEFTLNADSAQVMLQPRTAGGPNPSGNQLDRIVAQGDIQIQQAGRKAQGNQLVYTGEDQKFVLTGAPGRLPSIFDAEHGKIAGDSLTFFSHDGRVLVGSGETPHTLNQDGIRDASKK